MQLPSRRFALSLALALPAVALITACGGHRRVRNNVEPPQVQARIAQFVGADGNSVTVRVELVAYNPNPFELHARRMNAVIAIAGSNIETLEVTMNEVMPPQAPIPVVANITVPRANIRITGGALPPAALAQGIPFSVNGTMELTARRHHHDLRVPFVLEGVIPPALIAGVLGMEGPPPGAMPPQGAPPPGAPMMTGGPSSGN